MALDSPLLGREERRWREGGEEVDSLLGREERR